MDNLIKKLGINIEVGENEIKTSMIFKDKLLNHIGSFHAGVLFTFAEISNIVYLEKIYYPTKIKAELKKGYIKYPKPAKGTIHILQRYNQDNNLLKRDLPVVINLETYIINNENITVTVTNFYFNITEIK